MGAAVRAPRRPPGPAPLAPEPIGRTSPAPEPGRLRSVAGRYPTGVAVLAVAAAGAPHGMTVNSFTTVSLDPPLVAVCVRRGSRMSGLLPAAGCFAVTVLAADAARVSAHFANPSRPDGHPGFAGVPWSPAPGTGSPVLDGGVAYFDCVLHAGYPAGDHDLYLGRVIAVDTLADVPPLLFLSGRYRVSGGYR